MRRPPRIYQAVQLRCRICGQPVRSAALGGWEHVKRIGIMDPRWHLVVVR